MLKNKIGIVLHKKTDKTALVLIKQQFFNAKYKAIFSKHKNYLIHDEENKCKDGNIVLICPKFRYSKAKSWSLSEIIS